MTRRDAPDERNLLDRILNTPQLAQVVPRHQPELFHRVIQSCGLEDCAEIVAPATPEQSAHIFDLDLWRPARPGPDEQFDPDRFGVWLEVLVESGAAAAAQKLTEMDVNLVIAGLAQRRLVYDRAAVTTYETTDGEWIDAIRVVDDGLTFDVGGYLLVARRADSREAIVAILPCLADRRRAPRLDHIRARLEFALDRDQAAYSARNEELAYLANCSIQARPFTAHEASDAAIAACNLGLENWPPHWLPVNAKALPDSFHIGQDLAGMLTVLHEDVLQTIHVSHDHLLPVVVFLHKRDPVEVVLMFGGKNFCVVDAVELLHLTVRDRNCLFAVF